LCFKLLANTQKQQLPNKSIVGLKNTMHFATYVHRIFDNEEKKREQ